MSITRTQIRDYVRSKLGELDNKAVKTLMLDADINFSQRKVQKDLMPLGIKSFIKEAYNDNYIFTVPSDIMDVPNAIINLLTSTATPDSESTAFPGAKNDLTFTLREPNGYPVEITFTPGTAVSVTYSWDAVYSQHDFAVVLVSTTTTGTVLLAALQADLEFDNLISSSLKSGDDGTGAITLEEGVIITLTGSTGGWYPADEVSLEDFERMGANTYQVPSATKPIFVRKGDVDGVQTIEMRPFSILKSKLQYYYLLADLSSDSSTLGLRPDYEELFLTYLISKTYESLKQIAESKEKQLEYATKLKEYEDKYALSLQTLFQDKVRLQSNDTTT